MDCCSHAVGGTTKASKLLVALATSCGALEKAGVDIATLHLDASEVVSSKWTFLEMPILWGVPRQALGRAFIGVAVMVASTPVSWRLKLVGIARNWH